MRGNGTDEDVVRSAGAEQADLLMALTEGDNRNALAAQLGKHTFGIPRVIAKINDPLRGEAYRALGLETICRTIILGDVLVVAALDGHFGSAGCRTGKVTTPKRRPGKRYRLVVRRTSHRSGTTRPPGAAIGLTLVWKKKRATA